MKRTRQSVDRTIFYQHLWQVVRNSTTIGVDVQGDHNVLKGNKAVSNGANGIVLEGGADGNRLSSNVANANDTIGIDSKSDPDSVLTSNFAGANTQLGIDAAPSGVDGGGNAAKLNGNAHQCENVVCAL